MKDSAGQAVNEIRDQARSTAQRQREAAAQRLHAVSDAIRQTGQRASGEDSPMDTFDALASQAADYVEQVAQYLKDHDIGDIIDGFERWARRNPTVFLAGSFIAGAVIARFFKSSQERRFTEAHQEYPKAATRAKSGAGGRSTSPLASSQYGAGAGSRSTPPGLTEPTSVSGRTSWEET